MCAAGFAVRVTGVTDTTAARKRLGMPDRYGSCHSATVGGYVLEGHVPANDVKRLLKAKPKAWGWPCRACRRPHPAWIRLAAKTPIRSCWSMRQGSRACLRATRYEAVTTRHDSARRFMGSGRIAMAS